MTQNEKLLMLAAVALAAWLLYARSKGIHPVTGEYLNTMIAPEPDRSFSPVVRSDSTSTLATNVANQIGSLFSTIIGRIGTKASGNAPVLTAPNSIGIDPFTSIGRPANQANLLAAPDVDFLNAELPYWQVDPSFNAPVSDFSSLAWTTTPGNSYIPPPQGA